MFNHFLRYVGELQFHVFRSFHWCVQIKIFDIHHQTSRIWGGNNTVDQYFEQDHICCLCSAVVWVIYSVSSHCESRLIFFCFVWSKITGKTAINHIFNSVDRYVIFSNELHCICSFYLSIFEAICQSPKLIGRRCGPCCTVLWMPQKLPVVEIRVPFFCHESVVLVHSIVWSCGGECVVGGYVPLFLMLYIS
jgi:hypothetical protein